MSDPRIRRRTSLNVQRIANSLDNQMAYTRRSSAGSYRRYGRRYSSYGRSYRNRSRGQYAAANGQRDSSRVVLKWSQVQQIEAQQIAGAEGVAGELHASQQGWSVFNAWRALLNSGFYENFAEMYDQIKLNAVKVKITLLSASSSLFSATNNPVFVCAWDRNGVSANSNISESPFRNISSYGSAITRPMTVGANFGMQRYLFASTMAEKTQYIPTRLISSIADASDNGTTMASTYPFKPALLMAIYSANSTTTNSIFSFNVEWQFDVTFRGTRNFPESTA